jgi:broad specificity phosphatase PhoE
MLTRLRAYLPSEAITVSSDLRRAVATADAIAPGTRLPHQKDLREFDFGLWDGMTFDAVAARDPVLSRTFWEEPGDLRAPQGESWNDVAQRVSAAVDRLVTQHRDAHLICVAHIGVIMTQIQRATGSTAYQALGHRVDNLSVTDMRLDNNVWRIGRINHLA